MLFSNPQFHSIQAAVFTAGFGPWQSRGEQGGKAKPPPRSHQMALTLFTFQSKRLVNALQALGEFTRDANLSHHFILEPCSVDSWMVAMLMADTTLAFLGGLPIFLGLWVDS